MPKGGASPESVPSGEEAYYQAELARANQGWTDRGKANVATTVETFTLESREEYVVQYMGTIAGIQRGAKDLIDYVDTAKRLGNVSWRPSVQSDTVRLIVNKYGIKCTDMMKHEVFARMPMNKIGSVVHYREDSNQHVVAIETGNPQSDDFTYYLYQCQGEAQAKEMCGILHQAFDVVHAKAILDHV